VQGWPTAHQKPFPNDSETGGEDSEAPLLLRARRKKSAIDLSLGPASKPGTFTSGFPCSTSQSPLYLRGIPWIGSNVYSTSPRATPGNSTPIVGNSGPSLLLCHNGVHTPSRGSVLAMYGDKRMWGRFFVRTRCSDPAFRHIFVQRAADRLRLRSCRFRTQNRKRRVHEFMVRYHFRAGKDRNTGKYKSVRYL
jgi:hypothetical protein